MSNTTQKKLRAKIRWGIIGVFALIALSLSYDMPQYANKVISAVNNTTHIGIPALPEKEFSLGLDLQGGAHLIYQADVTEIALTERAASVEGVRDVIERRVNGIGVGEPNVQTTKVGEDFRIIVELPGVTDVNQAIGKIGETPILEFKEQNSEPARELTSTEAAAIKTHNKSQKTIIDKALADIKWRGKSFEDVAKEVSNDTQTRDQGGYLGYVNELAQPELHKWASDKANGALTAVVLENDYSYTIAKKISQRESLDRVGASHILVCYLGASNCNATMTKDEARQKAEELREQVTPQNFASLAAQNSTDTFTAQEGGNLGSFARGEMLSEFEEPVFNAVVGEILPVIETVFGYHIIMKNDTPIEHEVKRIILTKETPADYLPQAEEWKATDLSGKQLERAEVVTDSQTGAVQVSIQFDNEGKDLFEALTEKYVGAPIAIFLDGNILSAPTVQQPIRDGRAVITGNFTLQDAKTLAQRLNAGALPVPVELISQQAIGATLGAESLQQSLKAGILGIIFVMIFMLFVYRLPGLLSTITLLLYVTLTLAIFKLIGVTLTLAGIAGLILSIGMAVDANVLIFERLKEELQAGKSLKSAVEEGFARAWTSIRDGNTSTLITCVMLIWFGSSFVKGFAITLFIGVLISMFSAITATRIMLRYIVPWFGEHGNWMFLGAKKGSKAGSKK